MSILSSRLADLASLGYGESMVIPMKVQFAEIPDPAHPLGKRLQMRRGFGGYITDGLSNGKARYDKHKAWYIEAQSLFVINHLYAFFNHVETEELLDTPVDKRVYPVTYGFDWIADTQWSSWSTLRKQPGKKRLYPGGAYHEHLERIVALKAIAVALDDMHNQTPEQIEEYRAFVRQVSDIPIIGAVAGNFDVSKYPTDDNNRQFYLGRVEGSRTKLEDLSNFTNWSKNWKGTIPMPAHQLYKQDDGYMISPVRLEQQFDESEKFKPVSHCIYALRDDTFDFTNKDDYQLRVIRMGLKFFKRLNSA